MSVFGQVQAANKTPTAKNPCSFTDVEPGAWYADAVAWAQEDGVVNGVGSGKFDPTGSITREQFATIIYRACSSHWRGKWPVLI